MTYQLRCATAEDGALMREFMLKLGTYQKMREHITATPAQLATRIARGEGAAVFLEKEGQAVAFMYYYVVSSAFIGEAGYYIDALYIDEAERGQGLGRVLMRYLAREAKAAGYGRIEWGCLDWNTDALAFYETFGAKPVSEMHIHRIHQAEIDRLVD